MFEAITQQSFSFLICLALLLSLVIEAALKRRRPWAVPALIGYGTIGAWYLMEPLYFADVFSTFDPKLLDDAYTQVALFLLSFRILLPSFARLATPAAPRDRDAKSEIPAETYLAFTAAIWVVLFLIGTYRLDGDVFQALFPLGARTAKRMWSRAAADTGETAFLVSSAAYLYTLTSASFGILLPFIRRWPSWIFSVVMIVLSWPYFLLDGSRNVALAVIVPAFVSYWLFSKSRAPVKITIGAIVLYAVDLWFRVVVTFRNVGFGDLFAQINDPAIENTKHLGLNMLSELYYINGFYDAGILSISLGVRYLEELANVVPRAFWPDKPLVGIDYAILRGFGGGSQDIGVTATISTGIIGQGVVNFGPFFGPIISALLFAAWAAILSRLGQQRNSVMRLTLFLLGLGLTFNLGRDVTLLVLWPMVFGCLVVRLVEYWRRRPLARRAMANTGSA